MPKKTLIIDTETGLLTLHSRVKEMGYDSIKEAFGIQPFRVTEHEAFQKAREMIAAEVQISIKHEIFGTENQSSYGLTDAMVNAGVDGIVLDTVSSLNQMQRQEMRRKVGRKLNWDEWDKISNDHLELLLRFTKLPIPVIMTCHTKGIKDDDSGIIYDVPALSGSASEEFPKQFDFVLTAQTIKDKGIIKYVWQTKKDTRVFCKDRTNSLPLHIEQDFSLVLDAAYKLGYYAPKILVLGKSGTGKTRSLCTLINPKEQPNGTDDGKLGQSS